MNSAQSARLVFICAVLEAAFIFARHRGGTVTHDRTVRSLWAIGVLGLGLSMLADFAPQVAGPFAILVLVALAARSRGELGAALGVQGGAVASSPSSTSRPTAPPGTEAPGHGPGA